MTLEEKHKQDIELLSALLQILMSGKESYEEFDKRKNSIFYLRDRMLKLHEVEKSSSTEEVVE